MSAVERRIGSPSPIEISRKMEPPGVRIRWSDGLDNFIPALLLRRECPCANCAEARGSSTHDAPLGQPAKPRKSRLLTVMQAGLEEQTEIVKLWPVGNYALGVLWGDKHDSGIYQYELLRRLAAESATEAVDNG